MKIKQKNTQNSQKNSFNSLSSLGNFVFSTNPEFMENLVSETPTEETPANQQDLRLHLLRLKGNKVCTCVRGFVGSEEALAALAKLLKQKAGVGGSAKEGEILLQGDVRDKIEAELTAKGYKHKRSGG